MKAKNLFLLVCATVLSLVCFTPKVHAGAQPTYKNGTYKDGDLYYTITDMKAKTAAVIADRNGNFTGDIVEDNYPGLTNVTIKSSITVKGVTYKVTSIYHDAFNSSDIEKITIPASITEIDERAFYKSALYNNSANWTNGGLYVDGCLIEVNDENIETFTVKNGTRLINKYVFKEFNKLREVSFPKSLTYIGKDAFNTCINLKSVVLPNSVVSIENSAFNNCYALESVTLPENEQFKVLSGGLFYGCSKLTSITLPKNITTIEPGTFTACTALKDIYCSSKINLGNNAFGALDKSKITVHIPARFLPFYQQKWSGFNFVTERFSSNGIYYDLTEATHTASIEAEKNGAGNYASLTGKVTIPKTVTCDGEQYQVTGMKAAAFAYAPMTWMTIEGEISTVPEMAFLQAPNLTDVTLPESVTEIGTSAFNGCSKLENVPGLTNDQTNFLTKLNKIGERAFYGCVQLPKLRLLTESSIGEKAFNGCTGIKDIVVGQSVSSIGAQAFAGCTKLEKMTNYAITPQTFTSKMLDGVDKENIVIYVQAGSLYSYQTADGWKDYTLIGMYDEFDGVYYMLEHQTKRAYIVPETNNTDNYKNLPAKVTIPATVTKAGQNYRVFVINNDAFKHSPVKEFVLPETMWGIGQGAFEASQLEKINLPTSVVLLRNDVFKTSKLQTLELPEGLTSVPRALCMNCGLLDKVVLPSTITKIEEGAFYNCIGLGTITIPENVTVIEKMAFKNCKSLYAIYNLNKTPQTIEADVFEDLTLSGITLYVPYGSKATYEAKDVWKEFTIKELNVVVDGLNYIINNDAKTAKLTFDDIVNNYTGLSGKVTIPATITFNDETYQVTELGNYAFQNNKNITELVLPEGIKEIGADVINDAAKIAKMNIPSTVNHIFRIGDGNPLISNDANYTDGMLYIDNCLLEAKTDLSGKITVKDGTRLIAGYAFFGCKEITEIVLPETVQEIGDCAFRSCKKLQGINIPEGITVLRRGTFGYCDDLGTYGHRLILPNSLVTVEREVFSGCYNLREITFPENVRSIGNLMFWDYSNPSQLQELVLPAGIQELKELAFYGLGKMVFFYCFSTTPEDIQLGDEVFSDMNPSATLYVPYGYKSKYAALDQWKDLNIDEMPVQVNGIYYETEDVHHTAAVTPEPGKSAPRYSFFEETSLTIPAQIRVYNEGTKTYEVYTVDGMDDGAFDGAPFTTVRLPEGMKYLGAEVFSYSDLATVYLPSTIKDLGSAFMDCEHLKTVYCYRPDPIDISSDPFEFVDLAQATLYVPYGCADAYNAADGWKDFGTIKEMAVCVDGIYYELDEVKHEATVTYQFENEENYAGLSQYDVVLLPASITVGGQEYAVTAIGDDAFAHCPMNGSLGIAKGIKSIGARAFAYSDIANIHVPPTVSSIGEDAFLDVNYSLWVHSAFPPFAFTGDPQELVVPYGSKSVYEVAEGWKDMQERTVEMQPCIDNMYYSLDEDKHTAGLMEDYSRYINYRGCYEHLGKEVVLPSSVMLNETKYKVTTVYDRAFLNNKTLKRITLPETVGVINGSEVFVNCTALESITCQGLSPAFISNVKSFEGVDTEKLTVYVHHQAVNDYKSAFIWKDLHIESIESPIVIAGQFIYSDQYGKPLKLDGITGEVVVTANTVTLGDGASIQTGKMDVPVIEFFADETHKAFTLNGINATLSGGKNPAIRINGAATLTINGAKDGNLLLESECADGAIVLADEAKVTLQLNTGDAANNIKILSAHQGICIPQTASCDIQASGHVDIIVGADECPLGNNNRTLTLNDTYMILPFGGEVNDKGLFDAFGEEAYRLRLAPETTQSGKAYPVELTGFTVTEGNAADILGDGHSSYDAETNTLTLNTVNYNGEQGQVLRATEGLNLALVGKNILSSTSGHPCIEVIGGDFVISGDKDAELTVNGTNGIQCDESQQYRMEVRICKVDITALGEHNQWALQTDSLFVDAATLHLLTKSSDGDAVAWLSWNSSKSGGLLLQHALLKKGSVNVNKEILIEPVPSYTVTFTDKDDKVLKEQVVFEGEAAEVPEAPEVEGYTFIGWDQPIDNITADLTVKPEYELITFTVTFVDWDGTQLFSQSVPWGTEADTPKKPYREGYTFKGWDKDYSSVKSDLVVTAQYEILQFTVTFLGKGGVELSKQTVDWNTAAEAPEAPAVEGYTFKGWDTDFSKVTKDLEVNALYEINKYTVTFVDWDGKELSKQTVDWDGAAIYPSDPKREGHTFTGWDKAIDHVKADLTVTAQYKINTFTVTFYDHDGKVISTQTVNWNEAAKAPEAPAWEGHTFTAWDTDFEHVKADLDIKPVYDTILYTVKFVDWNGNELKAEKVEYGKSATAPVNPVRDGYTFTGWDKAFDNITGDLTVTAQYEAIDYTPTNLQAVLLPKENDDVQITLSWDKVTGAASYELRVSANGKELFSQNTATLNVISVLLSGIEAQYQLTPGTYTIDWAVRSTNAFAAPISDWAEGESFEITVKDTGTGVENVQSDKVQSTKVMENGVLYIMYNGTKYNVQGKMVK